MSDTEIARLEKVVTVGAGFCKDGCGHAYPIRQIGTPPVPCVKCGEMPTGCVDVFVGCANAVDFVRTCHVANPQDIPKAAPTPPSPRDAPPRRQQTFEEWHDAYEPPGRGGSWDYLRNADLRRRCRREGWDAAVAALAPPATTDGGGWVPVGERLPPEFTDVLGVVAAMTYLGAPAYFVGIVEYRGAEFGWHYSEDDDPLNKAIVSHWMLLPPPPVSAGGAGGTTTTREASTKE